VQHEGQNLASRPHGLLRRPRRDRRPVGTGISVARNGPQVRSGCGRRGGAASVGGGDKEGMIWLAATRRVSGTERRGNVERHYWIDIMGWATPHIEKLRAGETVSFRPRGNSMSGKIESGQLCMV